MLSAEFDKRAFRLALGGFVTGVTIMTTRDSAGNPAGLTVNSFNSVSLEPPLVLWSLAKSARCRSAFSTSRIWTVHILAVGQEELSARFASRIEDKFAGLQLEQGLNGLPLLRGCVARLQCRTAFEYEGGDHLILVGEVVACDRSDEVPLLFHGGTYAQAVRSLVTALPA